MIFQNFYTFKEFHHIKMGKKRIELTQEIMSWKITIMSLKIIYKCNKNVWTQSANIMLSSDQIRSDQSLSRVRLFATPWIAARHNFDQVI